MPSSSSTPSARPASWRRDRRRGAQTSVRSGNRGPSSSALLPEQRRPAGEVEVVADDHQRARPVGRVQRRRRRWSGSRARAPSRRNRSTGWTTRPGSLPSYRWKRPWSAATGTPADRPEQQPPDVARRGGGGPARQLAERDRRPDPRPSSARLPSPDPSTMPTLGTRSRPRADGVDERGEPGGLGGRGDRGRAGRWRRCSSRASASGRRRATGGGGGRTSAALNFDARWEY